MKEEVDTLYLMPVMNTYNCDSNIPYIEIQCERQLSIKQVAFFGYHQYRINSCLK